MNNLEISIIKQDDWELYKELRLISLKDSPDSFGSTYKREVAFEDNDWKSRLDQAFQLGNAIPLFGKINGHPIGLAWGVQSTSDSQIAHIYQMWISPNSRGQGVGRLLLKRIISWAKEKELKAIVLAVTTTNIVAATLYKSIGFRPFGELEVLREGSQLFVQPMILELFR